MLLSRTIAARRRYGRAEKVIDCIRRPENPRNVRLEHDDLRVLEWSGKPVGLGFGVIECVFVAKIGTRGFT